MKRRRVYDCWWCGDTFTGVTEHMVHVSTCTAPRDPRHTRAVHCPACAAEIDLRVTDTCTNCGRPYNGETAHT